ncbi:MAG TPA: hybrid sensor histidine kinase/response regulator, partial [Thermoanaerobaculia bacterium]|nr:hybrid sensor histidine kinase/response regulator [Thermoanaerobaculia bacterium]
APVPLHDLLERSVGAARAGFRERGLELTLRVEQPPPAVSGDPVRLEQVVGNLLTNALKYTPAGGSVRVSLAREADEAVIRVKDTGVGIAPEVLPRVFDLFVQAEGTLDRAQGGMGIGLTLVRSLVELHGGSVSAASAGSDKGSEFTVRLPLLARGRTDASPGASEHPRSAHRRIVIVEDNADVRIPLEMLLSDLGHEVVGVEDGEVAVERIVSLKPELALVDIGLPHLDGYEVARRVRAALGDSVLLVALTGYGQPEDRRRALAAGFDAHMTKPIQIAALERMIAGVPAAFA